MAEHSHKGHRERVKKRYVDNGLQAFEKHEMIEMLLYYGVLYKDTNPLAHRLIETFGSVGGVLHAERDLLLEVEGVTEHVATLLNLVGDLHRYCEEEKWPLGTSLHSTKDRVAYLKPRFDRLPYEATWMVSLDVLGRVLGVHQISKGSPVSSEVSVRDVLRYALTDNAVKVIFSHNHPSGMALPSDADVTTTVTLAKCLKPAGIQLVDHLIFARDSDCISFRDTECLKPALRGIDCG